MMNTRQSMLASLQNRKSGFALPQPFYTDPDFFKLDMETIWYREWLFVGHDCELPEAGSYLSMQIGAYPVFLVRDKNGEVRAFHNSCRHRGSLICTKPQGKSKRLVCPYHQWTYDHGGALISARHMKENFDKSGFGLKPIACEEFGGYIFVCLAEDPTDFGPVRDLLAPYIAPYALKDAKVAYEYTIVEKGNWKLVWENNRECYHCLVNHPELCKSFPENPSSTGHAGVADPELDALWADCEQAGLPSKFRGDSTLQFRAVRTSLVNDALSYTVSGAPAVNRPLGDSLTKEKIGALLLYHYPSTWNHYLRDHAISFRLAPISVGETALTTKWLVHKDAVEGVDYKLDDLTHVWKQTNDQDRQVVEHNSLGVSSPAYEPGPYSDSYEDGVVQFVEWYAALIEPRLKGGETAKFRSVA